MDTEEFWRQNADPIALHQAGEYESQNGRSADSGAGGAMKSSQMDVDDTDLPF